MEIYFLPQQFVPSLEHKTMESYWMQFVVTFHILAKGHFETFHSDWPRLAKIVSQQDSANHKSD